MSRSPEFPPTGKVRAVDVMLDVLRDEGVTTIFGNPGSTEMPLMDALYDRPDFRYILGLQEASVVAMADGYALKSGAPAFVNLHAAGGIGNAMGVLVASKASETPMVVTAGQQDTRHLFSDPWLSGDLVALAQPVTKWAAEVRRPEDVALAMRRAFAIARTAPQGPVFLSLPMDILDAMIDASVPPRSAQPAPTAGAGAADLGRRLAGIAPQQVALLIGDDVPPDAAEGIVELAEAGGFVVYGTQVSSRAAFPSQHPCWAGMLKPDFAKIREKLGGMEAVVLIGGRAFVAYPYRDVQPIPVQTKFFHLAAAAQSFGIDHPADAAIVGDLRLTLLEMAATVRGLVAQAPVTLRLQEMAADKAARTGALRAQILAEIDPVLSPDAAVLAVLDAIPKDAILANDAAATFGKVQDLLAINPGNYFFARGGVLGCAMPASVGISLAQAAPVVCLMGDGGAMYSPQALWSAAHYRTKTLFVVFNNRRYNVLMNVARDLGYDNARAGRFVGMDLVEPAVDFAMLARSMGVAYRPANNRTAILTAIEGWLAGEGPMMVEVRIR